MTEHDLPEGDEQRPKVRVVDKRRYREGDVAPAEEATSAARPADAPAKEATGSVAEDGCAELSPATVPEVCVP